MSDNIKQLVQQIHQTPARCVLAITGGGTEAIGLLLRHGDGSKTLLQAFVPYDNKSFQEFVKGTPDQYCSEHAARQLAMAAYQKANDLVGNTTSYNDITTAFNPKEPVFGLGATCSLAKAGAERAGRQHKIYIAIQTANRTVTFSAEFDQGHIREEEEYEAALWILRLIAFAADGADDRIERTSANCGQESWIENFQVRRQIAEPWMENLVHGILGFHYIPFNESLTIQQSGSRNIFPGSFNPIHEGHLNMIDAAHKATNQMVALEISIGNVDKPILDYIEIQDRISKLRTDLASRPYISGIYFTTAAKFTEKAAIFRNSNFLVGYDTLNRVFEYSEDIEQDMNLIMAQHDCHFMLFPRIKDGVKMIWNPAWDQYHHRIMLVPDSLFTPSNLASSELRKAVR